MALLLSQLTPVVDTGPIGTGVNCLDYEVWLDSEQKEESFIFFISEDFIPPVVSVVFLRPSRILYPT